MLTVLLVVGGLLAAALAIRSRAPARRPRVPPEPDVGPERRHWEIWKRLGWGERLTMIALGIGVVGAVSFALYGLVLLVW